jgi:hypothetical protein
MTPEQRFVNRLWRFSRVKFRGRKTYPERVEISDRRIAVIDTHPDQPDVVLVELTLNLDGSVRDMHWQSDLYPFLELRGHRAEVERAVKCLFRTSGSLQVAKGA